MKTGDKRKKGLIIRMLQDDEIERIHLSTLDLLEQVGLYSDSETIMKVFLNGGADVDLNKKTIKIPRHIVEESIKKAPKQVKFFGRNSKHDLVVSGREAHFGMGGTPVPFVRDIETGEIRQATRKDVEDAARLGDFLPNMAFLMTTAAALDVPSELEYEYEWEALLNNTEKPIIYVALGSRCSRNVLKMLAAAAGGIENLRKKPIAGLYADLESPLYFPKYNENIIEFAKVGVPVALGAAAHTGMTAPVTLAGALVMSNAMNLSAITLTQLVNPGTPVIYAAEVNAVDPWTLRIPYGDPERAITTSVVNAQLSDYYGLPTFGYSGCADSKLPDAQAGAEVMMLTLMSALSGINLIHDCGYLASGSVGSLEMVIICDEIISMVSRIVRGIDVNDETLAMDVMREVGPKGSFLSHKHTLKFFAEEIFIPKLFDRKSAEEWTKAGKKDIGRVAREKAMKILKEHHPEPLSKETKQEIKEIIEQAKKEL
jgi:trimethylamine--corrinoid protein Co-methyltransferase